MTIDSTVSTSPLTMGLLLLLGLFLLSMVAVFWHKNPKETKEALKTFFAFDREGKGILKGIVIAVGVIVLCLLIAQSALAGTGNGRWEGKQHFFRWTEISGAIDYAYKGDPSPFCEPGHGKRSRAHSDIVITQNVYEVVYGNPADRALVLSTNARLDSHNSCAFAPDRNTLDVLGAEFSARFYW